MFFLNSEDPSFETDILYGNDFPSPDGSGNPFVSAAEDIKDCNGLLRQFALSGSGAGSAPENGNLDDKNVPSVIS